MGRVWGCVVGTRFLISLSREAQSVNPTTSLKVVFWQKPRSKVVVRPSGWRETGAGGLVPRRSTFPSVALLMGEGETPGVWEGACH